ncbi:MAG: short-subunit dehydrogenase [Thermoproteota archaeon]|jgi:short-subunit dehydrogenase
MYKNFKGKWALITGASSGLGADFSRELAQNGTNLVLVARRAERLEKLKKELESEKCTVVLVTLDLTEEDAVTKLIKRIDEEKIEISVLINNAGFGVYGPFLEESCERQLNMIDLNIRTLTELTHKIGLRMKSRFNGYILLVSSVAGFQPAPLYTSYAASKAYVLSFGEALHEEFKKYEIKVSTLSPGMTRTEFLDVAGQDQGPLQNAMMMESLVVVRNSLKKLNKGHRAYVPGFLNKVMIFFRRLFPVSIQAKLAYLVMRD